MIWQQFKLDLCGKKFYLILNLFTWSCCIWSTIWTWRLIDKACSIVSIEYFIHLSKVRMLYMIFFDYLVMFQFWICYSIEEIWYSFLLKSWILSWSNKYRCIKKLLFKDLDQEDNPNNLDINERIIRKNKTKTRW